MANDTVSRSWFAVLPYPEKIYKGSPEEILEQMKQQWIGDNPLKKGHWAYCISKEGMPHVHMVLEGSVSMRFSAVRKCYGKAHLEPTRGSRKMVLQYIHKRGKFAEKGERVVCFVSYGNIEGNKTKTLINQNAILDRIEELIEDGKTPNEIMGEDIRLRKEETLVRKAFFAKRYRETPPYRKVTVVWHLGESGSGKTFSYTKLCESRGEEEIYFCAEYANKGVGAFDLYSGEKILFLDEPAAGMNNDETRDLINFLRALHKQTGLAIILIEHHLEVVMELCRDITVLNLGAMLAHGTPEEIQNDSAVIKAYIGERRNKFHA